MKREELEDYHNIVVRLKELKTTIVTDSVKGSSDEYPYTSHPVTLHGVRDDEKAREEVNLLEQKKNAIDGFIDGITDMRVKTVVELRIRQHCTWSQVGQRMEESPDAVRMCYYKIFSK